MTDQLGALIAANPGLARASRLSRTTLPVCTALEDLLPDRGLRVGTTTSITGVGATSLALALLARASSESWIAVVGMPDLGLAAASEFGVDLSHLVVVPDPGKQYSDVLSALVDAFDVVLAPPAPGRSATKLSGRVRERDTVLVCIGRWPDGDLHLRTDASRWHGIGDGHGHLQARTLEVSVTGRRDASREKRATVWLPDVDGDISKADKRVVPLQRSG